MKVGVHLEQRLTVTVHSRHCRSAHPFIAGVDFGARVMDLGGNVGPERMMCACLKHIAEPAISEFRWTESSSEGIDRGHFKVIAKFLVKRNACPPTAGRAAVVGETIGKVILE